MVAAQPVPAACSAAAVVYVQARLVDSVLAAGIHFDTAEVTVNCARAHSLALHPAVATVVAAETPGLVAHSRVAAELEPEPAAEPAVLAAVLVSGPLLGWGRCQWLWL